MDRIPPPLFPLLRPRASRFPVRHRIMSNIPWNIQLVLLETICKDSASFDPCHVQGISERFVRKGTDPRLGNGIVHWQGHGQDIFRQSQTHGLQLFPELYEI